MGGGGDSSLEGADGQRLTRSAYGEGGGGRGGGGEIPRDGLTFPISQPPLSSTEFLTLRFEMHEPMAENGAVEMQMTRVRNKFYFHLCAVSLSYVKLIHL